MKFGKWIETYGLERLAIDLNYRSAKSLTYWVRGKSSPPAMIMEKIVKLSKGKIKYSDIIAARKGK